MAPERRAESSSRAIIDLTISDDENDTIPIPRPDDRYPAAVGSGVLPSQARQPWDGKPIRPPPRNLSTNIDQRSSQPRKLFDHTSSSKMSEHSFEELENPTKRRKTHNGPQNSGHRKTPIPPPALAYRRDTIQPAAKLVAPPVKTIIGGLDRQESSRTRISPEGRIQKPQHSTTAKKVNEIFKHVNTSLSRYKDTLPVEQRRVIGQKASRALVDPSSFQEFTTNSESLPEEYGIALAGRAKAHVDRFAAQALINRNLSSLAPQDSMNGSPLSIQRAQVLQQSRELSDSDLSGSEDTFESAAKPLPGRNYSSSPTTSFDQIAYAELDNGSAKPGQIGKLPEQLRQSGQNGVLSSRLRRRVHTKPSLFDIQPAQAQRKKTPDIRKKIPVVELPGIDLSNDAIALEPSRISGRPYLGHHDREALRLGLKSSQCRMARKERDALRSSTIHLDFSLEEIKFIHAFALSAKGQRVSRIDINPNLPRKITSLLEGGDQKLFAKILRSVRSTVYSMGDQDKGLQLLRERSDSAIRSFLEDACSSKIAEVPQHLRLDVKAKRKTPLRISTLLLQREISGLAPHRICSGKESFNRRITSLLEDEYVQQSEWTDCCGDISAITWTSNTTFICGATAHSDFHNMQYNKPGNLVLGSTTLDTLRALPNHRVVRPKIAHEENAENALQSMRNTQDPWIYTSVVSTAYCHVSGFAFTASFDQTVKVWSIMDDGSHMELRGAWYHEGKVNFVVTSDHHSRVATACDVMTNAIRVYSVDTQDITGAAYDIYCGERARAQGEAGSVTRSESLTGYDQDIPEDKRDTGELCLWDVEKRSEIPIQSAKLQNIFEVLWHPSQPIFLAATSPCGPFEPLQTKTQIRMFAQTPNGTFMNVRTLDCPAMDINELTIMPNCRVHSYVTASCTDGNTYVYDTALGEQPIHILNHGESLDSPLYDMPREQADTGVKFAAWGQNKNRFYTGASDGKVKAWDITAPPCHAFVRDVLVVSGGVSAGAFSKDQSQLVVGDATGKVHLLRIDDSDIEEEIPQIPALMALQARGRQPRRHGGILPANIKRPKVVIPHPEPAPPGGHVASVFEVENTGRGIAKQFIDKGMLVLHPDPRIGAVQGPNYAESNLFFYEGHQDFDGNSPLLPEWQIKQHSRLPRQKRETTFKVLSKALQSSDARRHRENLKLDLSLEGLSLETKGEMRREKWEMEWDSRLSYNFEEVPSPGRTFELFREDKEKRKERKFWDSLFEINC